MFVIFGPARLSRARSSLLTVLTLHGHDTDAYPRDNCIAPDIADCIHRMHYEHKFENKPTTPS